MCQSDGVLLALDVPFCDLQSKLEAAKIGVRSDQITKQYHQHIATILFGRAEVVGRGLYLIADPAEHIQFPGAVKPDLKTVQLQSPERSRPGSGPHGDPLSL